MNIHEHSWTFMINFSWADIGNIGDCVLSEYSMVVLKVPVHDSASLSTGPNIVTQY